MNRGLTDMSDYSKYYWVDYYCSNCMHCNHVYIEKGKLKPQSVVCDNCGCETKKEAPR